MDCLTCSLIIEIERVGLSAAASSYNALGLPFSGLLAVCAGIPVLLNVAAVLIGGKAIADGSKEMAWFLFKTILASWMMIDSDLYLFWVYQPLTQLIFGTASAAAGGMTADLGLASYAQTVEANFVAVWGVTIYIWTTSGWDVGLHVAGLLLLLPYLTGMIIAGAQITLSLMLMLIPYALGPVFLFCLCFKITDPFAKGAISIYAHAAVTVVVSAFILGSSGVVVSQFVDRLPPGVGESLDADVALKGDGSLLAVIIVGWLSVWLVAQAPGIATMITGAISGAASSAPSAMRAAVQSAQGAFGGLRGR